jgi:hypothetical protein
VTPRLKAHFAKNTTHYVFVSCTWSNTLAVCTPGMWKNCITHCETLIQIDWEKLIDTVPIADISPIIISLGDSDDE